MSRFNIETQLFEHKLAQPFTIARGTQTSVKNVLIKLTADGITGFGEAAPNKRYDEDSAKVFKDIKSLPKDFFDDFNSPQKVTEKLEESGPSVLSARAAVEMAWLDWWGKKHDQPLWKLWDCPSNITPPTSYTIGLDEISVMQQKVKAATEYPILKVKLGTDRDQEIIKGIREITDKPIRVDANEGWKSLEIAQEHIAFLAEQDIEIVEQPMPSAMSAEMRKLKQWSPLPLMADESFLGSESLDDIAEQFDGINIKLAKIASLVKGREVIQEAQRRNLDVMVGCMIESSLGIAAAALLGTWADYVDLDGYLLIKSDPFEGLGLTVKKEIKLQDTPGLAVFPVS